MVVEIVWFILLPIYKEMKIWFERRSDIWRHKRARIVMAGMAAFLIFAVLPLQGHISVPAVYHYAQYRAVYPSAAAVITKINAKEGQAVKEGDVIMRLESLPLKRDLAAASAHLQGLQNMKRREQTDSTLYRERRGAIDQEIEAAQDALESLQRRQENLIIRAEFDGVIRDMSSEIHAGRNVNPSHLLFRLIQPGKTMVTGYLTENQLARVNTGNSGVFTPRYRLLSKEQLTVREVATVNVQTLNWPELASVNSGPIAAEYFTKNKTDGGFFPRQTLYTIEFSGLTENGKGQENQGLVIPGRVRIEANKTSILFDFMKRTGAFLIREIGLNNR